MATLPPPDPNAPRLFLDASTIVSGIISEYGGSFAILALAELGLIRAVVCPYVMKEVERGLNRKVPELMPSYEEVKVKIQWDWVPDPAKDESDEWLGVVPTKDAPVLAAAVIAKPHRLVTLDTKHFIDPVQVSQKSGLDICTPRDILREIRATLAQQFGSET